MIDVDYEALKKSQLQDISLQTFDVQLRVKDIVASDIPTSHGSYITLFQADHQTMYALCESDGPQDLNDVQRELKSMGIEAESYLPPHSDENYFLRFGRKAYLAAFPARIEALDDETAFYQTLTPYNPALVRIAKVGGEIRRYNPIRHVWQKDVEFSYVRPQVQ